MYVENKENKYKYLLFNLIDSGYMAKFSMSKINKLFKLMSKNALLYDAIIYGLSNKIYPTKINEFISNISDKEIVEKINLIYHKNLPKELQNNDIYEILNKTQQKELFIIKNISFDKFINLNLDIDIDKLLEEACNDNNLDYVKYLLIEKKLKINKIQTEKLFNLKLRKIKNKKIKIKYFPLSNIKYFIPRKIKKNILEKYITLPYCKREYIDKLCDLLPELDINFSSDILNFFAYCGYEKLIVELHKLNKLDFSILDKYARENVLIRIIILNDDKILKYALLNNLVKSENFHNNRHFLDIAILNQNENMIKYMMETLRMKPTTNIFYYIWRKNNYYKMKKQQKIEYFDNLIKIINKYDIKPDYQLLRELIKIKYFDLIKNICTQHKISIKSNFIFSLFPRYKNYTTEEFNSVVSLFNNNYIMENIPSNIKFFQKLIKISNNMPVKNVIFNYINQKLTTKPKFTLKLINIIIRTLNIDIIDYCIKYLDMQIVHSDDEFHYLLYDMFNTNKYMNDFCKYHIPNYKNNIKIDDLYNTFNYIFGLRPDLQEAIINKKQFIPQLMKSLCYIQIRDFNNEEKQLFTDYLKKIIDMFEFNITKYILDEQIRSIDMHNYYNHNLISILLDFMDNFHINTDFLKKIILMLRDETSLDIIKWFKKHNIVIPFDIDIYKTIFKDIFSSGGYPLDNKINLAKYMLNTNTEIRPFIYDILFKNLIISMKTLIISMHKKWIHNRMLKIEYLLDLIISKIPNINKETYESINVILNMFDYTKFRNKLTNGQYNRNVELIKKIFINKKYVLTKIEDINYSQTETEQLEIMKRESNRFIQIENDIANGNHFNLFLRNREIDFFLENELILNHRIFDHNNIFGEEEDEEEVE
jgi:hypothetical protein